MSQRAKTLIIAISPWFSTDELFFLEMGRMRIEWKTCTAQLTSGQGDLLNSQGHLGEDEAIQGS